MHVLNKSETVMRNGSDLLKTSSDRSGETVEWQCPVFNAARPCKLPVPAVCFKASREEMSNVS